MNLVAALAIAVSLLTPSESAPQNRHLKRVNAVRIGQSLVAVAGDVEGSVKVWALIERR
jgi:hypothetical protein